jgi:hypothetical protein
VEERGVIIGSGQGKARVRFDSSPECSGCCGCPSVGPATRATTEAAAPLKAALLLYAVPLALLFTGYATGSALAVEFGIPSAAPAIGAAVGALFFFSSLGVLRLVLPRRSG